MRAHLILTPALNQLFSKATGTGFNKDYKVLLPGTVRVMEGFRTFKKVPVRPRLIFDVKIVKTFIINLLRKSGFLCLSNIMNMEISLI